MDDELKKLLETMREENSAAHRETRAHVAALDAKLDSTAERMREENAAAHTDTRRHFDAALEGARAETRLVAESVTQLTEEVRRGFSAVDKKIDSVAAETQAMIKFSHAELDRRLTNLEEDHRSLEETVADLQTRVERLESTH